MRKLISTNSRYLSNILYLVIYELGRKGRRACSFGLSPRDSDRTGCMCGLEEIPAQLTSFYRI